MGLAGTRQQHASGTRLRGAFWYRRFDEGILAASEVFAVKLGKARVTRLHDLSLL